MDTPAPMPPDTPPPSLPSKNQDPSPSKQKLPPIKPSTHPFMCGYLDKSSGDARSKDQVWSRKYVEVYDGVLRFSNTRTDKMSGVTVNLLNYYISVQNKRYLHLESKEGLRTFKAPTESRAQAWAFVIAQYCPVVPAAEGFCLKLSGGKKILEERYLRLTGDGILSWFKSETNESNPRGSIQIRGKRINIDSDDDKVVFVTSLQRQYHFKFMDNEEASRWTNAFLWHSRRNPLEIRHGSVRE